MPRAPRCWLPGTISVKRTVRGVLNAFNDLLVKDGPDSHADIRQNGILVV